MLDFITTNLINLPAAKGNLDLVQFLPSQAQCKKSCYPIKKLITYGTCQLPPVI